VAGYDVVTPQGAFYMFPRVPSDGPGAADDVAFVRACVAEGLLVVPGSGFGCPGHFRLSYAVPDRDIELACAALERVRAKVLARG
jgi:aspartate aminotransferase